MGRLVSAVVIALAILLPLNAGEADNGGLLEHFLDVLKPGCGRLPRVGCRSVLIMPSAGSQRKAGGQRLALNAPIAAAAASPFHVRWPMLLKV